MGEVIGVDVKADDDIKNIYSSCFGEDGAGVVERGVGAVFQQESMRDTRGIEIYADDVVLEVAAGSERSPDSSGIVDDGVFSADQQVSVSPAAAVGVEADDGTGQADRGGVAADCARWIKKREDPERRPHKTVARVGITGVAAGRVGTGNS